VAKALVWAWRGVEASGEQEVAEPSDQDAVVETICAVVQGGYVTARLSDDPEALERACRGLIGLLGLSG
jgi:hypothetical protein